MKKRISLLLLVLLFMIFSVGISYSYFIYKRASETSVIKISLGRNNRKTVKISEEEIEVSMEPMTTTTARNRTDNYFDFNVESENYSDDEASFCVSVDYGTDDPDKQRIPLRYISFDLENRSGAYYVSGQSFDDISHMHCLYIKSQPAHNGTVIASFRLRFWLNTGITVSDSDTSSVFKATDDNPDDDRINYSDLYNNFVVTVESDSREEYHKSYTIISNTSLRSGIDTSAKNAKTLEFKYGYDETYDSIPSGFKKNNLQTSNNEPIYSYYDSSKNKIVVFSESYIYTTFSISSLFTSLTNLEKIEFNNFYFNNLTTLDSVFENLSHLKTLDLDVSTPYITSLSDTFYGCSSLTEINFGENFNTANVTTLVDTFRDCTSLINLDISMFEFSNVTSLFNSIYNCSSLEKIDFGYCNLKNVTNMSYTFYGCTSLEHIYWETTNTPLVTTFNSCFFNCPCLISVDLSNLTFDSATNISSMFKLCESLGEIDLSNASNNNIHNSISYLFTGCYSVTTIKMPNLDLSGVTDASYMFNNCGQLNRIDSMFNFSDVLTNTESMFNGCRGLVGLNLINMDVSNVTNFMNMFEDCTSLKSLDVSSWDTSSATNIYAMFQNCCSLKTLDLSSFDNSLVTSHANLFCGCSSLVTIYVSEKWVTMSGSYMVFDGCINIVGGNGRTYDNRYIHTTECRVDTPSTRGYLTLKNSNVSDVINTGTNKIINLNNYSEDSDYVELFSSILSIKFDNGKHDGIKVDVSFNQDQSVYMFVNNGFAYISSDKIISFPTDSSFFFSLFPNVKTIDFNHWIDTSYVTDMLRMFSSTGSSLTSLDLRDFNTSRVTNFQHMFRECRSLTSLDLSSFDTSRSNSFFYMFYGCSSLTSLDLSNFVTSNTTVMAHMFRGCSSLTTLDISSFNTSSVYDMQYMFFNCLRLQSITLGSDFDTSKVKYFNNMFNGDSNLVTINVVNSFDLSSKTDDTNMFNNCSLLKGGNGTTYSSSNVDSSYAVIDTASTPGYFTLVS